MIQAGCQADLPLKSFRSQGDCQFGMKQLECDRAIVTQISGEVYHGHAAAPELALDEVAIAECCGQRGVDYGHRVARWGMLQSGPAGRGMPRADRKGYSAGRRWS